MITMRTIKNILKEDKFYIIALAILILIFNIRLPFYVNAPGGTININNRIEYQDKKEYKGSLNMLYVTEYVSSIPFYLLSHIIPDWDLESIKENQVSSTESVEEINKRNKILLENSINNATYVAYKSANKKIEITKTKYVVVAVTKENGLKIGDEILEVEGKKVSSLEMIKQTIEEKNVGDEINLKIKRNNKEQEVVAKIEKDQNKKALGVMIVTNYNLKPEKEVKLKFKQSESGSSGGLMMSLSIYSAISDKDILKGRNIAGTGTIDMNGNVGEIGGIKYKIMGAVKNKMDVVLVPSANYEEAIKVKEAKNYKIKIVKVDTFMDAIDYLTTN